MGKNVGTIDKVIRIIAGLALIGWALTGGPLWAWIGVVPLATGLLGWCPAYTLFGIKTCPTE
ncbi:YgaP family membrane protein [Endothiovibrio diazotrophicus]